MENEEGLEPVAPGSENEPEIPDADESGRSPLADRVAAFPHLM